MDDHRTAEFVPLRLRLHPGNHAIDLTGPDVLVGRHSEADLRMAQPDVSRQHCRFQFTGHGWQVLDLGSLNGVYVNGARVRQVAVIHPGDQIRICGVEFDVEGPVYEFADAGESEVLRTIAAALPQETITRRAS